MKRKNNEKGLQELPDSIDGFHARACELELTLANVVDLADDLAFTGVRINALARASNIARDLAIDLARDRKRGHTSACDMRRAHAMDRALTLTRALALAHEREQGCGRYLIRARECSREIVGALKQVQDESRASTILNLEKTGSRKGNAKNTLTGVLKFLETFAWFCSRENREHIKLITADLQKDNREMQKQKQPKRFIQIVLWGHVATTVGSITWDGFRRLLGKILPIVAIVQIFKKLKGH